MNWLCNLGFCLFGLALIGVALVYPVNSKLGQKILKKAGVLAFVLLLVAPVAKEIACQMDAPTLAIAFVSVSVIAYFVREARKPRRADVSQRRRAGGGERKPVLPRSGGES